MRDSTIRDKCKNREDEVMQVMRLLAWPASLEKIVARTTLTNTGTERRHKIAIWNAQFLA